MMKPNTPFKLVMHQSIHPEALRVLTLLYQPIIGSEAMSTYLTLASYANFSHTSFTYHQLIQVLGTSMDGLMKNCQKLEAVSLIQTYENQETKQLSYFIALPLSAVRFFNDGIINVFLSLKIGAAEYQQLKLLFLEKAPLPEGQNISKAFNELFDTSVLPRQMSLLNPEPIQTASPVGLSLDLSFDEALLNSLLKQFGIDNTHLSSKVMEQLNKVAFLYKLDEHELARLVFDSVDVDGFVNLETFRRLAKQHFQLLNKGKPVSIKEVDQEAVKLSESVSKSKPAVQTREEKIQQYFTDIHPIDFLKEKSHQKEPVPADRQLVDWLVIDQQMPPGVVNVLMDYVLRVSKGRLPKVLVEKIAGEWQRKNITTVQMAMDHAKEALKPKEVPQTTYATSSKVSYHKSAKPIRQEQLPDWFVENQTSTKPEETTSLSADELNKIEKMRQLQEKLLKKG